MIDWRGKLKQLGESMEKLTTTVRTVTPETFPAATRESPADREALTADADAVYRATAAFERCCPTWAREAWKPVSEELARWSRHPIVNRPELRASQGAWGEVETWSRTGRQLVDRLEALAGLGASGPVGRLTTVGQARYLFRPEGDSFCIAFEGETFKLPVSPGLFYIRYLLGNPDKAVRVVDLKTTVERAGVSKSDHELRAAHHRRRKELKQRLEMLKRLDPNFERSEAELSAILKEQRELDEELRRSTRTRMLPGEIESVRRTVSQAVGRSLDELRLYDAALADHLARCLQTGTYCRYTPPEDLSWKT